MPSLHRKNAKRSRPHSFPASCRLPTFPCPARSSPSRTNHGFFSLMRGKHRLIFGQIRDIARRAFCAIWFFQLPICVYYITSHRFCQYNFRIFCLDVAFFCFQTSFPTLHGVKNAAFFDDKVNFSHLAVPTIIRIDLAFAVRIMAHSPF